MIDEWMGGQIGKRREGKTKTDREEEWREPQTETREKPKWEKENRVKERAHPTPPLYLGLHLQGERGPRHLFPGGRGKLGFLPLQGLLSPTPSPPTPHPSLELISGCHLHREVLVKEI